MNDSNWRTPDARLRTMKEIENRLKSIDQQREKLNEQDPKVTGPGYFERQSLKYEKLNQREAKLFLKLRDLESAETRQNRI